MKRSANQAELTYDFMEGCRKEFKKDPVNILTRNIVNSVGSSWACIDSEEKKKITHIFLNSIKAHNLKATNQSASGRCWLFAGLNIFRHFVINALNIPNFEFSETYLFFWDKFERSNNFLQFFIDNDDTSGSRLADHVLQTGLSDGGYWNFFANLVEKYGVVPKSAMEETFQSSFSEDMNITLMKRLISYVNTLMKLKNRGESVSVLMKKKKVMMKNVYNILIKFLGEPTKTFTWHHTNEDNDSNAIVNLTPMKFKEMVMPDINLHDFIILSDIPNKEYYKVYEIPLSTNMVGGKPFSSLNVPSSELEKYTRLSILSKTPVWFAGDVTYGFDYSNSVLSEKVCDDTKVFGKYNKISKGDRVKLHNLAGTHAMLFTGCNIGQDNKVNEWQVENSWGYYDNETPGEDGFLCMTKDWFHQNVVQVAIHKNFLSKRLQYLLEKEPIILQIWDSLAPACKVTGTARPLKYLTK